jgi:hypothetical protein
MPAAATPPSRPPRSVRDFAWRVAGPRDFVINLLINTAVPFWVFRGHDLVPLTGRHSVASVVLPMSFLLCTLTTFFGWFNCIKERRAGAVVPAVAAGTKWAARAWLAGLAVGLPALTATVGVAFVLGRFFPDATIGYWPAVLGIGITAGLAGLFLHARAVERGGAIGVPLPEHVNGTSRENQRWRP